MAGRDNCRVHSICLSFELYAVDSGFNQSVQNIFRFNLPNQCLLWAQLGCSCFSRLLIPERPLFWLLANLLKCRDKVAR